MRILVTGGAGFIGSHLAESLLAAGHTVVILDDFNDFYDPQIKQANIAGFVKDVTVHHVDLRDGASVRNLFHREKFEVIAHVAARAGVRPSIQHPQLYYDTNVIGTLHLLEASRVTGVERFICLRRLEDCAFFRRSTSDPNAQPVCCDEDCRRSSLLDLLASLSAACRGATLLHRIRSAATAGPGDSSIHTAH